MKHSIIYGLFVVVVVTLVSSCSSTSKVQRAVRVGDLSGTEYVEKVISQSPQWTSMVGRGSVVLHKADGKRSKVNMALRIKRDVKIQLSIIPVLGIEWARMEFTPEHVLFVDRMKKRYVEVPFSELSAAVGVQLDYHILQSLLLNEIFLPGTADLKDLHARRFLLSSIEGQPVIEAKQRKRVNYAFFTDPLDGLLKKTCISLIHTDYQLNWDYSDFAPVASDYFPRSISVSLEGVEPKLMLTLNLSRITVDDDWKNETTLSAKYKRMPLGDVLKMMR